MTLSLWYLRRAVPWSALLGGLVAAGVLVALVHRWEDATGAALPVVALLAAAGAAFAHDEPAVAVTGVTPRGGRWAPNLRYAAALAPPVVGLGLLVAAPGTLDRSDWALVVAGLAGTATALAGLASLRHVPRPGAAVAGLVVFLGLTPLAMGPFLDLPELFPSPGLTDGVTTSWAAVVAAAVVAVLVGPRVARP